MNGNIIDIKDRLKPFALVDIVQRDRNRIKAEMDRLHSRLKGSRTAGDELFSYAQGIYKDARFIFYKPETRCDLTLFAHKYARKLANGHPDLDAYIAQMSMDH